MFPNVATKNPLYRDFGFSEILTQTILWIWFIYLKYIYIPFSCNTNANLKLFRLNQSPDHKYFQHSNLILLPILLLS